MTTVQRVAQIFGWVFVIVAVWGFFVSRGSMEADPSMAPAILGLFPVNLLHNLVHLGFGVWGIMAARSFSAARSYAMIAGVLYLVLAILGFVIPTTFGLIPIGGHDIWLHGVIGLVLAGVGFTASEGAAATTATASPVPGPRTTTAPPPPPPPSTPAASEPASQPMPPQSPPAPPAPPSPPSPGMDGEPDRSA